MNWEAFFAISVVMSMFAVVLAAVGWFLARLARKAIHRDRNRIMVTPAGAVFALVQLFTWLGMMGWAEFHPDQWLHHLLSLPFAVPLSALVMCVPFMLIWHVLQACGITLFRRTAKASPEQVQRDDARPDLPD